MSSLNNYWGWCDIINKRKQEIKRGVIPEEYEKYVPSSILPHENMQLR